MAAGASAKLQGGLAWLGLGQNGARLEDRTVVISPHLDDAIFSLGAAIARAARGGAQITVLTVLAGDPASAVEAGEWDRECGFATAAAAAAGRRVEDRRACALVGATPAWLEFSDEQYERGGDDDAIRAAAAEAVAGARAVLLPGFPLLHPDHAWLAGALGAPELFGAARVGRYVEQPYAAQWADGDPGAGWGRVEASLRDRVTKVRAWKAYESQLGSLGKGALGRAVKYEGSRGGELVAWGG